MEIFEGVVVGTFCSNPGYLELVFKVGDSYKFGTILPRWNLEFEIGEKYIIGIKRVKAGKTKWYDAKRDKFVKYKYNGSYIEKLIPVQQDVEVSKEILSEGKIVLT